MTSQNKSQVVAGSDVGNSVGGILPSESVQKQCLSMMLGALLLLQANVKQISQPLLFARAGIFAKLEFGTEANNSLPAKICSAASARCNTIVHVLS